MSGISPIPIALLLVIAVLLVVPLSVSAAPETCNYADDDGDGKCFGGSNNGNVCYVAGDCPGGNCVTIDEDFNYLGTPVQGGCDGIGECGSGIVYCVDTSTADCSTNPGGFDYDGSPEVCDYLDNDCDGVLDDQFNYLGTPVQGGCDGIGECGSGIVYCVDTSTADCSTNPGGFDYDGSPESCNGLDDDCDALSDEDFNYQGTPVGGACDGIGECGSGTVECDGASAADCSTNPGGSNPQNQPEVCDGKDNDCNSVTDDGGNALCSNGLWCDGTEICGGFDGCSGGTPVDCDDEIECSVDSCDEANDQCVNTPDDDYCDNGLWCDGAEYCHLVDDCQYGTPVDCSPFNIDPIATCFYTPDGYDWTWDVFTGFVSSCNEAADACTTGTVSLTHTCDVANCGAECDAANPCASKCVGDVYHYGGSCGSDCSCSYSTNNCNLQDRWYDTGATRWVSTGQCTQKEQKEQQYRDYHCGTGGCSFTVTGTQWVDTGVTGNKPDGTPCEDGNFCTVNDECLSGVCSCDPRDCSANNLPQIATCTNNPDNIAFTWDWFPGFTSTCDEQADACTTGTVTLTHTCDRDQCGADCDSDDDCASGTCLADCTCEEEVLEGDVNGDCVVNLKDLAAVGKAFNSCSEGYVPKKPYECRNSRWDQDADINMNGIVNLWDLLLVAMNYGDMC